MRQAAIVVCLLVLVSAREGRAGDVSREAVEMAITKGVGTILSQQKEDGSFSPGGSGYPCGMTGLAVMALQYARPHLKGELQSSAFEAIRKGLAYITQQEPEQKTYSAGLILCALFRENPRQYQRLISQYAGMLVRSQHEEGILAGQWGYNLLAPLGSPRENADPRVNWGDNSNNQFALLGLYHAQRSGYQVPFETWKRSRDHYLQTQTRDGGWGYKSGLRTDPYSNMTIASSISLYLCEEQMFARMNPGECKPPTRSMAIDRGIAWIADTWGKRGISGDTYGLYALERLGIIMGRANIGGYDWYEAGAQALIGRGAMQAFMGDGGSSVCFGVMFLARGLEPIVINKLQRRDTDDWNNTPYDIKNLIEHIQDHYQQQVQWRIVTLEAPLELLLKTPILHISGHKKLDFNETEKAKLKAYVDGGGTILGQACCSKKAFDQSFRAFVKEVFGGDLKPIPKGGDKYDIFGRKVETIPTHRIYERMKGKTNAAKTDIEVLALDAQEGRAGVIYLPDGIARRWHLGGKDADNAFAAGTAVYFYVTIEGRKILEGDRRGK